MKKSKLNIGIMISILSAVATAILQFSGIPVPNEAYGVAGGLALTSMRNKPIKGNSGIKQWYESKTIWFGATLIVLCFLDLYGIEIPNYIIAIISASGVATYNTSGKNIQQ